MIAANREQRLPGSSPSRARGPRLLVRAGPHAVVLAAVPLAAVLGLLAIEDALELGSLVFVAVLAAGFGLVVALLLVGLRDLRAAEARSAPDHGSAFTVWLPRSLPQFDGAVLMPGSTTTPDPGHKVAA